MSNPPTLRPLPDSFAATREALRTLACYAISPARKALDGRIDLCPCGDGFATPLLPDGSRIAVHGDRLERGDESVPISTLTAAAAQLGIALVEDPGVGNDLPPFAPDASLAVDADASFALGRWYSFGQAVIDRLRAPAATPSDGPTWSEAQLWPEHFDLATMVRLPDGRGANVGFSPGDGYHADPYAYVGPHDMTGLAREFWNAPFGAVLGYADLLAAAEPLARAVEFVERGLAVLADS